MRDDTMSPFESGMEWAAALDVCRLLTQDERETLADAGHQEDEYARWFAWGYESESVISVVRICEQGVEQASKTMWELDQISRAACLPCGVGRVTKWGQLCALSVYSPAAQGDDSEDTANRLLKLTPLPEGNHLWRLLK